MTQDEIIGYFRKQTIINLLNIVQESGRSSEIDSIWFSGLQDGESEFKQMVKMRGLSCKYVDSTGNYFVEPSQELLLERRKK